MNAIMEVLLRSLAVMTVLCLSGCTGYKSHETAVGPKSIWCNERYLPEIDARAQVTDDLHLNVAKQGYLYALLGAYVLQKNNEEGMDHRFSLPSNIETVKALSIKDSKTGLEAETFKVYSLSKKEPDVVIAFAGTNDDPDWDANLSFTINSQYDQARKYVLDAGKLFPGTSFAVTGYSLGGGLAAHVTKHEQTSSLVKLAWLFNPSPKTWVNGRPDERIWQASTSNDVLKTIRLPIFRMLPGFSDTGAYNNQKAENFYLIKSNPVYAHFRWALARNILHTADLALYKEGVTEDNSEPLKILKLSRFSACKATLNASR